MFCPYCGAESNLPEAGFCSKCGKQLEADRNSSTSAVVAPFPPQSKQPWNLGPFWLLALGLFGSLLGVLLPMANGHKPIGFSPLGVLIWSAALISFSFKKSGRKAWAGAVLGLLGGFAILFCINTVFSALWARGIVVPPAAEEMPSSPQQGSAR
jgi:hypothetical protein